MEYEDFLLLTHGAEAELIEKKSRFIATVKPTASEEEAVAFIEEMKKKYYDARHNCSAFVIGSHAQITRSSDDGEPSGTAGRPILEVLLGSGIRNVTAVVTRYFGGTLLGTGGLVRAYSGVVKEAIKKCKTAHQQYGVRFKISADYGNISKIQHILLEQKIDIENSVYETNVELTVIAPIEEYDRLCKELVNVTSAHAKIEELERLYYMRHTLE